MNNADSLIFIEDGGRDVGHSRLALGVMVDFRTVGVREPKFLAGPAGRFLKAILEEVPVAGRREIALP